MKAKKIVQQYLKEIKQTFDYKMDLDKLRMIAMISTNKDELLSQIISEAVNKIGPYGQIMIEPSNTTKSELVLLEGGTIGKGMASTALLGRTNAFHKTYENSLVLLLNFNLES